MPPHISGSFNARAFLRAWWLPLFLLVAVALAAYFFYGTWWGDTARDGEMGRELTEAEKTDILANLSASGATSTDAQKKAVMQGLRASDGSEAQADDALTEEEKMHRLRSLDAH